MRDTPIITDYGKPKTPPVEEISPQEKKLQGEVVNHHGKKFEFSYIYDGNAYFKRIEWKKGVKQYLPQYVMRKLPK